MRFTLLALALALSAPTFATSVRLDDPNITPLSSEPMDYFSDAQARVHEFLPNAQFYSVSSKTLSQYNGFCTTQAWKFTFIDDATKQIAYIAVRQVDASKPGGEISCVLANDVAIQKDYQDMTLVMQTVPNPRTIMAISYKQAFELIQNTIGKSLDVKSTEMTVQGSGQNFLELNVDTQGSVYQVDMTHGSMISQ